MVVTGLSHLQRAGEPHVSGLKGVLTSKVLTSFTRLLVGVLDDVLVPLLSPDLIVVLNAARFIRFRLLRTGTMRHEELIKS